MRTPFIIAVLVLFHFTTKAQLTKISDTAGYRIIEQNKTNFPKFYKVFHQLLEKETLLKQVVFINEKGKGPASANINGTVTLNLEFFINKKPLFDDNRLIVVIYHEVGHLHYLNSTPKNERNVEDNEKAAFEYSLKKTKEMAIAKDCLPLNTGLYFMLQRSKSDQINDPHVRALKKMVNEPLYLEYLAFQKENCKP